MIQKISRRKYSVYAFDIESHNDKKSIEKQETSMWLGCLINDESDIRDSSSYFYDMDSVLDKLEELSTPKRSNAYESRKVKNIAVYVYNLSFEWSFILPYLYKRDFSFKEEITDQDERVFNSVSTKSVSSVWVINIKFNKNSGNVLFRDLAKIYGGGLGNVAKSFNLETQKGSINYRKNRLWTRKPYKVTCKEKVYCFKDTRIIIDILEKMKDDREFWNSSSMATYSMKKLLKVGYPRAIKPYKEYRKEYPELDEEETAFLRKGVEGGITYAPSLWQFKEIHQKILHIDAHQMHPSQGYEHYFPCGKGEYFKGAPKFFYGHINACRIRISYDYVRLHSIIKLIGIDCIEDYELVVWDFEIPVMEKAYVNLEIEYIDGYSYKAKPLPWRKYYAFNYNMRLEAKKKGDDFGKLYYKLLNNSSYGKHLEKPHNDIYMNVVRDDGIIDSIVEHKDILSQEVNAKYTYLPVGSCIPAYSRCDLINSAFKFNYKDILYFDTDSIFVLATPENIKIWEEEFNHQDFLGGWDLEEIIDDAQFAAPKRYKTVSNGKTTIKMAGVNFNTHYSSNEVSFDEINIISDNYVVQRAFRCKGGTIVAFQNKQISVQKKYQEILEKNTKA